MPHTGVQVNDGQVASSNGEVETRLRTQGKNILELHLRADNGLNVALDVRDNPSNGWITDVESWSGRTDLDHQMDTAAGEVRVRLEAPGPDVVYDLFIGASG